MNDIVPLFFVSYSRGDRDRYLDTFVKHLRKQVSDLVNIDVQHVGFRDVDNLESGDDWKTGISTNARRSHSLVCLYSTRFFDKNRQHEYCAKEFAVFLKRNNAQYNPDEVGGQFRGAQYIFPVLWIGEPDLQAVVPSLPPYAVKSIQYTYDHNEYVKNGLQWMMKKKRSAYHDMLLDLARRIRDCTKRPLPPLEEEIDIERMYNAFWEVTRGGGRGRACGQAGRCRGRGPAPWTNAAACVRDPHIVQKRAGLDPL